MTTSVPPETPPHDPLRRVTDGDVETADPAQDASIGIAWRDSRLTILLIAVNLAVFAWQMWIRLFGADPAIEELGVLSLAGLAEGRWWTPLTSMFMHGGIGHILMNLSALLPFGLILGRRMGGELRGQMRLLGFYLLAGFVAAAVWLVTGGLGGGGMVGASGAIFGLWGAVLRLRRDDEGLYPVFSREVLRQLPGPFLANLAITLLFGLSGTGGIAWQAHVGGFLFGILTVGFFLPRRQAAEA